MRRRSHLILTVLMASALLSLTGEDIFSQPIGINTKTPLASWDVRGNFRIGGTARSMTYDSISARIGWSNSNLFVPAGQALIRHSDQSEGLYYNNSALEYRNQSGNPVFYTNWSSGGGFLLGPVGVGTNNPVGKLHLLSDGTGFTSTVNSNIILENDGGNFLEFLTPGNFQSAILFQKPAHLQSGGIYYNSPGLPDGLLFRTNDAARMFIDNNGWVGIGGLPKSKLYLLEGSSGYSGGYFPGITIEGSAGRWVDLVTPFGTENGILFGDPSNIASGGIVYNNVATQNGLQFRTNGNITRMVLTKTQFLGIGVTDPAFILDVNGRMRLRSDGQNTFTAGMWLNNLSNTEAAFIGMEDDTHIGFYGNSPAGWKFTMNTSSGALRVNGSEGLPGQTIVSNGSGTPNWRAPSNSIYNSTTVKTQTGDIQLTSSSPPTAIPGLDHTFTVPGNAKVLVSMNLHIQVNGTAIGYPMIFIDIQLDNNFVTRFYENLDEVGVRRNFKAGWLVPVTAGTHTIRIVVNLTDNVFILGNNSFPSSVVYKVIQE